MKIVLTVLKYKTKASEVEGHASARQEAGDTLEVMGQAWWEGEGEGGECLTVPVRREMRTNVNETE